ncbi:SDR family oxidoreductase [Yinghuangia sp. ASG 101]|uniref:SDR family oxidoreductase n=1 Tax=Yinghuangia sp. ASG 101 TaxID=2896848 RepID=UPI001E6515DD|nr:SDR family oxidoreductase [Yinghuangia sp. ASG 101]UGQ10422.1 SDR family oxidoreductase [Yinghuangia sp. ASG 101]
MTPPRRVALVTGASSGIGAATAALLAHHGYRVHGTTRAPDAITNPVPGVEYVPLDLTSESSIEACAAACGPVDVLVNNAGESQSGPLEELPMAAVRRLFETNVFGAIHLTQLLTPAMRARHYGRVVMVGSMLASFPLAYRSSYVASKAALRAFTTAARREFAPYNVALTTVEPGSINTGISDRRTHYVAEDSPFADEHATMLHALNTNEAHGIPPEAVAATILKAINSRRPKPLYAVGSNAPVVFTLRRLLPRTTTEHLTARRHGLR